MCLWACSGIWWTVYVSVQWVCVVCNVCVCVCVIQDDCVCVCLGIFLSHEKVFLCGQVSLCRIVWTVCIYTDLGTREIKQDIHASSHTCGSSSSLKQVPYSPGEANKDPWALPWVGSFSGWDCFNLPIKASLTVEKSQGVGLELYFTLPNPYPLNPLKLHQHPKTLTGSPLTEEPLPAEERRAPSPCLPPRSPTTAWCLP